MVRILKIEFGYKGYYAKDHLKPSICTQPNSALLPGCNFALSIRQNNKVSTFKQLFKNMAQGYKLVTRKVTDLKGGAAQEKVYAIPDYNGYTDMETLCMTIGARSTVSSADVKAVLDNLNFVLDMELRAGRIVQLGEFGNFRLSLSSKGANDKKSFTQADVKGARVIFTPGASLRNTKRLVAFTSTEKKEAESGGNPGGGEDDRPVIE